MGIDHPILMRQVKTRRLNMKEERKHALLGASNAYRWLACPPSARLSEKMDIEEKPSPSADEGTVAHALAEWHLKSSSQEELEDIKKSQYYGQDMEEYVAQYVDFVKAKFKDLQEKDSEAELHVEQLLDFSEYVPSGFGTGDAVMVGGNTLVIVDLKYGRHIKVEAYENPQLRLYALGALAEFGWLFDISQIEMSIVQPRNGGITTSVLSVQDILGWGAKVSEIAKVAFDGGGELNAGEHCRFCPCAPRCRAFADTFHSDPRAIEKDPNLMSDDELAERMGVFTELLRHYNKCKEYMQREALEKGKKFKGFKLVEGRSATMFSDEKAAIQALLDKDVYETDMIEPAHLKGITYLKKTLGEKKFDDVLGKYIVKPQGKPILVLLDDARPALDESDRFTVIEEEKEK